MTGPEVRQDWDRAARTGMAEAIWCANKRPDQILTVLEEAGARDTPVLLTRLSADQHASLEVPLDYDPVSQTAFCGSVPKAQDLGVAVVAAGSSDAPTAREAARTLEFHGLAASITMDVGVAGLWRLTEAAEALQDRRVIIAVAGFEGALFSVLAGLVPALVIAVPSPVGAGVAQGGQAALSSALASCAPGVVTVNIGNGFGAAAAAIKILKQTSPTV